MTATKYYVTTNKQGHNNIYNNNISKNNNNINNNNDNNKQYNKRTSIQLGCDIIVISLVGYTFAFKTTINISRVFRETKADLLESKTSCAPLMGPTLPLKRYL